MATRSKDATRNKCLTSSNKCHATRSKDATRNKCIASSNKCLTSSNKKLLVTSSFAPEEPPLARWTFDHRDRRCAQVERRNSGERASELLASCY